MAIAVFLQPASLVVIVPLAAVYGAALWATGLWLAARYARSHQPELLDAVNPSRAS